MGEAVQQRSGQAFRPEDLGPLVEGEVGGDQDRAPLVALAEDLKEQFRSGERQGDEAQLIDGQRVEQPSFVPGLQRSALPRFHRRDAPARLPAVYFANMALLDRGACRMAEESDRPGWKQPCLRPRLGIPPCRSSGSGWKTRFISPWQDGILLPIPARGAAG